MAQKMERSDAKRSREAIMQACKNVSGSQVTCRQIGDMMDRPIHTTNVNIWLRRLELEGFIKIEGATHSKYGKIITVIQ